MVRGAEQDGLLAQSNPRLAVLDDLVGDIDSLCFDVFDGDEMRQFSRWL